MNKVTNGNNFLLHNRYLMIKVKIKREFIFNLVQEY